MDKLISSGAGEALAKMEPEKIIQLISTLSDKEKKAIWEYIGDRNGWHKIINLNDQKKIDLIVQAYNHHKNHG